VPENLVLCYHAISPTWQAALSTTPERFERQLAGLHRRGYRAVRFSEAVRAAPRSGVLAVTFDDAFRSVLELGLPILQRLGMPATVFVPTDHIDSGGPLRWNGIDRWLDGPDAHELAAMSWPDIRLLADHGWEIGSHSASHPHLSKVDDATLADELTRSKAVCEQRLSTTCESLAYPYGDVDGRVVTATTRAGYLTAAALPDRLDSRDPMCWPRVGVYHADGDLRFRTKISPAVHVLRGSRAWHLVGSLRRARSGRGR
jgi:peptidoglycan/xylan/chitin deacetylase (PgdA/CDA1 family)